MTVITLVLIAIAWTILNIPIIFSVCTEEKSFIVSYCRIFYLRGSFKKNEESNVQAGYPGKKLFHWFKEKRRKTKTTAKKEKPPGKGFNISRIMHAIGLIFRTENQTRFKQFKSFFNQAFLGRLFRNLFGRFGLIKFKTCRWVFSYGDPHTLGIIAGAVYNIKFPKFVYVEADFIDNKNLFSATLYTTPLRMFVFLGAVLMTLLRHKYRQSKLSFAENLSPG